MTRKRPQTSRGIPQAGDRYESDDPDGERARTRLSKKVALYLGAAPEKIGIELDPDGWVDTDVFLAALTTHGWSVTEQQLHDLVLSSDEQRFALSDDNLRIRASR